MRRRGYTVIFLSDNIPQGGVGHIYEAMLEWKAEQDLQDISKDVKRVSWPKNAIRSGFRRLAPITPFG